MIRFGMKQWAEPILVTAVLAVFMGAATIRAQQGPAPSGVPAVTVEQQEGVPVHRHKWLMGSDFDLAPMVEHGFSSGGFLGRDGWRASDMWSTRTAPSFLVKNGFGDRQTDSYALRVDRFAGGKRNNLEGLWVGVGGDYWRNRIRTSESMQRVKYHDFMLTAGSGYRYMLSRHVYLDPWVGGHFVAAGQRTITFSGQIYHQPVCTPEASVKLGFSF